MKNVLLITLLSIALFSCKSDTNDPEPIDEEPTEIESPLETNYNVYSTDTLFVSQIHDIETKDYLSFKIETGNNELFYYFSQDDKGVMFGLDEEFRVSTIRGIESNNSLDSIIYSFSYDFTDSVLITEHHLNAITGDIVTFSDTLIQISSNQSKVTSNEDSLALAVENLQKIKQFGLIFPETNKSIKLEEALSATQELLNKTDFKNIQYLDVAPLRYWEETDWKFPIIYVRPPKYSHTYINDGYEKQLFDVQVKLYNLKGKRVKSLFIKYVFDEKRKKNGCYLDGSFEIETSYFDDFDINYTESVTFSYATYYAWGDYCSSVNVIEEIVAIMEDGTKSNIRRISFNDQIHGRPSN